MGLELAAGGEGMLISHDSVRVDNFPQRHTVGRLEVRTAKDEERIKTLTCRSMIPRLEGIKSLCGSTPRDL